MKERKRHRHVRVSPGDLAECRMIANEWLHRILQQCPDLVLLPLGDSVLMTLVEHVQKKRLVRLDTVIKPQGEAPAA